MTRRRILLCAVLAAALAGLAGYAAHLGYFGGQLFYPIRATRAPAGDRKGIVAVLLSGDMGFRVGLGPRIASRLANEGIPVVGVSSLVYFRDKRTQVETATLIQRAMDRAEALEPVRGQGQEPRIVLIGQSFGADMVNAGSAILPPSARRRILTTELVVPTDTINYQASPAELLELEEPDASALPTGRLLGWNPTVCIYGREEEHSLCPHLDQPGVTVVALPGGHRLDNDADAVFRVLMKGIDRARAQPRPRAATPSSPHPSPRSSVE